MFPFIERYLSGDTIIPSLGENSLSVVFITLELPMIPGGKSSCSSAEVVMRSYLIIGIMINRSSNKCISSDRNALNVNLFGSPKSSSVKISSFISVANVTI